MSKTAPSTLLRPERAVRARLFSWGAKSLFIGPSLNLAAHRNAVAVLALGLDGKFGVAIDPRNPSQGEHRVRSTLIHPNSLHKLSCARGRMAFLYLDSTSNELVSLRSRIEVPGRKAGLGLSIERPLIETLRSLDSGTIAFSRAKKNLDRLLGGARSASNLKLARAIDYLHEHIADRPRLDTLARLAHLSPSRFRHSFKELTGVTLRRYRMWVAMGAAMRCLASGKSLTDAAHTAGFSSSAHFSSAFLDMFGLPPSRLARSILEFQRA